MTTENSVQKKIVAAAMLVAPLVLGAVFAFGLGFTAPIAANADGIEWDDGYSPSYGGGISWDDGYSPSYDDCSYYGDCGGGYYADDCDYYGDCGGGYYADDCDYYGDCGGGYYSDYGSYGGYYNGPSYSSYPTYSYSSYPYSYDNGGSYYEYDSYEYSYDYYEYEYEYDYCTNVPGIQDSRDDCDRHHDDDLDCELTASDRTVEEGDRVTLEWDVDGDADYASINQGVGRVDEDGGEERVRVDEDTTFRLTVRDGNDEATCSVTVRVDEEDNTFSSIDFEGEPANNPPQVVYLSSIPYTGLEDITPAMLSYWLMLIAGAGMLGWFLVKNGFVPTFAFAKSEQAAAEVADEAPVGDEAPVATANAFVSVLENDADAAIDVLRDAAAHGESIESVLEEAAKAAEGTALESRVNAALEASRVNGIRGAKSALA